MNKLLALILGATFAISLVSGYSVYKFTHTKERDIQKLDKKFGTPSTHPEYYPIVHLATSEARPFCTAFVVDANYAVTAGHCIEEGGKLRKDHLKLLTDQNVDTKVDVTAVGYDEKTDFGLLQGDFDKFYNLKADFVQHGFIIGSFMQSCGYPFGLKRFGL